jgi:lysophospholipase
MFIPFSFLLLAVWIGITKVHGQNSYAPAFVSCPQTSLLRSAGTPQASNQALSSGESSYVSSRTSQALPNAWRSYLGGNATNTGYNLDVLLRSPPRMGIAVSGGGYRAALFGAGVISALDSRNASAVAAGTGGVLQSATYISGLSGGSWAVSSFAIHDWPTSQSLVLGDSGWLTDLDIVLPAGLTGVIDDGGYLDHVKSDVQAKRNAGFVVSITVCNTLRLSPASYREN